MKTPPELAARIGGWQQLPRWERAELGRALRRLGWSYGEIMAVLPVPKGTLAGWCRDIRLTPEQGEAIRRRTGSRQGVPRDTQRKRRAEVERIRAQAFEEAQALRMNPLWVAGVALYWAEGTKSQRQLEMANSDARVLRTFVVWVREFHRPQPEFVLGLNLHSGNDPEAARRYWAAALNLTAPRMAQAVRQAARHRPPEEQTAVRRLPDPAATQRRRLDPHDGVGRRSCGHPRMRPLDRWWLFSGRVASSIG